MRSYDHCEFFPGDETPRVDRETQITLFIAEKLSGGTLEAFLHYGDEEEIASFIIPLFFSTTVSHHLLSPRKFLYLTTDYGFYNKSEPHSIKHLKSVLISNTL